MIKHISGDLIKLAKEGKFDFIVHGCNCFHTMGAGVALGIRKAFPDAYIADKSTPYGDVNKLGKFSEAFISSELTGCERSFTVINAYTQYNLGANFDINAFTVVMDDIHARIPKGSTIGIPMIGAGIGGGNWIEILEVLTIIFGKSKDVTLIIVRYDVSH